jgi:hypothetical protein
MSNENGKLKAALELAQTFSVFPLVPNGKEPLLGKGWPKYATSNEAQITAWWVEHPDANIAIVMGENHVGIDLDLKRDGVKSWKEFEAKHEEQGERLPRTRRHRSWSGGAHLILQAPPGIKVAASVDKLGPGIEVRTGNMYLVGPGSTIDGKAYTNVNHAKIVPVPDWFVTVCGTGRAHNANGAKRLIDENDSAVEAARALLEKAPEATEGARNDTAFKVARQLYDPGISFETCLELMMEWNEDKCHPPLDQDELERATRNGEKSRKYPPGLTNPEMADGFEVHDIFGDEIPLQSDGEPEQPEQPQDDTGPGEQPGQEEPKQDDDQDAAGEQAKSQDEKPKNEKKQPRLYSLSFADACSRTLTHKLLPLIKDWLLCGSSIVVFGDSNTGKTFLALDICYHIAAGKEWAGLPVTQGGVLYVCCEGGVAIYHRFEALRLKYDKDDTNRDIPFRLAPCPIDLRNTSEGREWIVREVRRMEQDTGDKAALVVVDTLAARSTVGRKARPRTWAS